MNNVIAMIPQGSGISIFIKDFREDGDHIFVKFRSTINDIPFMETELFSGENADMLVIVGNNGTVLYKFHVSFLAKLLPDEE